ncbi:DUF523 and DUF1722 domain-containing protein [Marispirochaeta sp.]|uniref:YbgA family protein n=1 Tax=Marispirochaeta sp. TaxID=2038653 RepID=UPI0029C6068F|nr:DUF523 and DUF1722 domain-containing protein [Marispirochaeta sp.]
MSNEKIPLGISTCLLGQSVRYNGGHKMDRFILHTLGDYFEYVPVCPEVECDMPIPRESMRLEGNPEEYRLITHKTKEDRTRQMQEWAHERLKELEDKDLCGYIFKSKSPSSGLFRVKIYAPEGHHVWNTGTGIWAGMFREHFPLLPLEENGRLHDPALRENFIERVFVFKRWRDFIAQKPGYGDLVEFHTRHKLLIMSHDIQLYRSMGKLVAEGRKQAFDDLLDEYLKMLLAAMIKPGTVKKHVNVLQHIMGYFKKELSSDEKQEFLEIMDQYRREHLPLIVPVTILNHFIRKYGNEYLEKQWYLHPHPTEMKLRTHV